jgi:SSS family solute:Na+ symporter
MGTTPKVDGILAEGEWRDADVVEGVIDWVATFHPVRSAEDLALKGWAKHDQTHLYFAFEVHDDLLYGIETPRWLPPENAKAHELTRQGFPWFGDEMEILLNASNRWQGDESVAGDGRSWQMVCNLTKSRLGGVGSGGLLEGEPRSDEKAWNNYQKWIREGAQKAAIVAQADRKGYSLEWAIAFDPCIQMEDGGHYSPAKGPLSVGLNVALGDLDRQEQGEGSFGHFHHEQWWAGGPNTRTQLNNFGVLHLMGQRRP